MLSDCSLKPAGQGGCCNLLNCRGQRKIFTITPPSFQGNKVINPRSLLSLFPLPGPLLLNDRLFATVTWFSIPLLEVHFNSTLSDHDASTSFLFPLLLQEDSMPLIGAPGVYNYQGLIITNYHSYCYR